MAALRCLNPEWRPGWGCLVLAELAVIPSLSGSSAPRKLPFHRSGADALTPGYVHTDFSLRSQLFCLFYPHSCTLGLRCTFLPRLPPPAPKWPHHPLASSTRCLPLCPVVQLSNPRASPTGLFTQRTQMILVIHGSHICKCVYSLQLVTPNQHLWYLQGPDPPREAKHLVIQHACSQLRSNKATLCLLVSTLML